MNSAAWASVAARRLVWSVQEAGPARVLAGLCQLAALAVRRPAQAHIRTVDSGLNIGFRYPAQLMPFLVVLRELAEPEHALTRQALGPQRVAVDVGASIGTWTLCAAQAGARVYAVEPDPDNFAALRANVEANGFAARVALHDCALGAGEGFGERTCPERRYLANVRLMDEGGSQRVRTLDGFAQEQGLDFIDVLKVNTAGCEAEVLAGAMGLFRERRIGLALFLDGVALRPALDGLAELGYALGMYDARQGRLVPAATSAGLDTARPGPMNRYVVVKRNQT